jgi:hypothetical protein
LKTYLFTTGEITKLEEAVTANERTTKSKKPNLRTTIGDMKGNSHD